MFMPYHAEYKLSVWKWGFDTQLCFTCMPSDFPRETQPIVTDSWGKKGERQTWVCGNLYLNQVCVPLCVKVMAEDADGLSSNQLRFSIIDGNQGSPFTIDPIRGEVKVARQLDREKVQNTQVSQ